MPVDQRNLTTLVDDEFNEKLSRIPKGRSQDIASIMGRVNKYRRMAQIAQERADAAPDPPSKDRFLAMKILLERNSNWITERVHDYLKSQVSEEGKGRLEMVSAIHAERASLLSDTAGRAPSLPTMPPTPSNGGTVVNVNTGRPAAERKGGLIGAFARGKL